MLNKTILMGRLTADPVLRYTNTSQIPVASFSVAVERRVGKDKERVADFFNVVAWQTTGEFAAKNFTKGQPICVEGRLQQRSWIDEATKVTRYAVEVIAESLYFAGFKRDDAQNTDAGYDADFDPYGDSVAA